MRERDDRHASVETHRRELSDPQIVKGVGPRGHHPLGVGIDLRLESAVVEKLLFPLYIVLVRGERELHAPELDD